MKMKKRDFILRNYKIFVFPGVYHAYEFITVYEYSGVLKRNLNVLDELSTNLKFIT